VQLCIRPEDVRVRAVPADAANRLQVEVAELEFAGAFCRANLTAQAAADIVIQADFSSNLVRDLAVGPGRRLDIALPPDRLRVFAL
jgi:iron(III) transport system ATP-binding protein